MKHLELPYGERTLLAGDVSITNESFDHAFGVEHGVSYEVTDFRVFEYRDSKKDWVNVTRRFRRLAPVHLDILKAKFLYLAQLQLERESA